MSLIALLKRDILCTRKGRVYPNIFKKHAKSYVKHIASRACLGWSVPSLTVRPCLSQDFVAGGSSLRWVEKTKRGMNFTSLLTDFVCHGVLECVKKQ